MGPIWNIIPACGIKKFTGHCYSDGSERSHAGWRTSRAAFGIVQVLWKNGQWRLEAVVLGPLNAWQQAIPLAELAAAAFYIRHAIDAPGLLLFSDCQWVVDGIAAGKQATASALKLHADVWRRLHFDNERRKWPIRAIKVTGHAAKTLSASPQEEKNRVGNGLADAAAKLALLFHEMDKNDIEHAVAAWHASSSVAKYLARTSAVVYKANNDVKCPYRRRSQRAPILDSLHILKDPKHVALPIKDGVVCLWCNMRAQDTSHLEKHPCVAAKQHELWKSGDVIMCANCGGYSQKRAKWLKGECQKPNISAKFCIRRFFQKMQHPANGKPLPETPSFWHNTTREDEPTSRPSQQCHTGVSLEPWDEARWDAIRNIGQANPKWSKCDFSVPKPDDPAFLEAIRGNLAISLSDDNPP